MAFYLGDTFIRGFFFPQVLLFAHRATFFVPGSGWVPHLVDVSFPNLQAAHPDFYPSGLRSGLSLCDSSLAST